MCWLFKKAKPQIKILRMLPGGVQDDLTQLNIKSLYPVLLDTEYFYTSAEDWAEVFDYIYFKFKMPNYLAERIDCDDFSILLKGLVSSFFGLNYFAVVFGNTPTGSHAWNIFRDEAGFMGFEPQTGKYFPMGEQGYVPKYLLL